VIDVRGDPALYVMTGAVLIPLVWGWYSGRTWPGAQLHVGVNLMFFPATVLAVFRPMPQRLQDALIAVGVAGVLLICFALGRAARFVWGAKPTDEWA
jgi:hypothetical protein